MNPYIEFKVTNADILAAAECHAARRLLDAHAVLAFGQYLDRVACGSLDESPVVPYDATYAAVEQYVAEHAVDAVTVAMLPFSDTLATLALRARLAAFTGIRAIPAPELDADDFVGDYEAGIPTLAEIDFIVAAAEYYVKRPMDLRAVRALGQYHRAGEALVGVVEVLRLDHSDDTHALSPSKVKPERRASCTRS